MAKKYEYIRKTARYNGKRYEATGKTELEAMTKLAEKLAAAKRGENTISGSMTVNTWYQQWMDTYKRPKGLIEKSLKAYEEKYRLYIKPAIGHMRLQDVRDIHLQKILNSQAGMSSSHVKRIQQLMRQLFRRARQSRLIIYDPAELLELPTCTAGKRRSITEEERAAILAVAQYHPAGLWVLTLLYTGMRPGETAALVWGDIDFEKNEIHVHAAKEAGPSRRIKGPKTPAGIRDIPIHSALRPLLWAARASDNTPIFATRTGGYPGEGTMRQRWLSFRREMDIYMGAEVCKKEIVKSVIAPDLTPYCLRHTFCTDLQRAGVPLNVAKELMGHSNIQTTANVYTHRDAAILHSGIAQLDGSAKKQSTPKPTE